MKRYEYVPVEFSNSKLTTARSEEHRRIIDERAADGFAFAGWVPTLMGPSGKILSVDLVFEKEDERD
ncbi:MULTISPECIES: DUF4177 domain-containing protein [unclassified Adlercreutzia]|uniref:DUF4177 domain-containing protein n=1 Tax=unclassified Adlercreutzia TaxID=2636013 RepID=UPI0013EB82F4|nr:MULTISPECIES: DUF4177 domain-containing protein [unclassified Adlercreutzia]